MLLDPGEGPRDAGRRGTAVRISNWGMFLLGIYLILVGLSSFGIFFGLGQITGLIALIAGILVLMEHWRR